MGKYLIIGISIAVLIIIVLIVITITTIVKKLQEKKSDNSSTNNNMTGSGLIDPHIAKIQLAYQNATNNLTKTQTEYLEKQSDAITAAQLRDQLQAQVDAILDKGETPSASLLTQLENAKAAVLQTSTEYKKADNALTGATSVNKVATESMILASEIGAGITSTIQNGQTSEEAIASASAAISQAEHDAQVQQENANREADLAALAAAAGLEFAM